MLVVKNRSADAEDIIGVASIPRSGRSPGEGNSNPLQYSCLENPMDRGACRATVHGVAKSWTWMKGLCMHAHLNNTGSTPIVFHKDSRISSAWASLHSLPSPSPYAKFLSFMKWFKNHLSCEIFPKPLCPPSVSLSLPALEHFVFAPLAE